MKTIEKVKQFKDLSDLELIFVTNMYGDYKSLEYLDNSSPLYFKLFIKDHTLIDASILL